MNKIRYAFCCLIAIVFCTAGLFAGCGDPYANLRVRLSGDNLVQSSEENIYNLTLTKVDTDEDASWTTVVDVTLEGLDKGMLSSVIWNYDARYLNIEYLNNERTSARITGVTSTDVGSPTVVEVISEETSTVSAKINVTNIVEPKSVIGTRFNTGEFGIPLDIDYSLNVKEIFRFDPDDATPPEYTFEINGFTVQSGQVFNLAEDFALQDGLANVLAYPTNRDAYTDEEFSSLTYTIENVRLYSVLTEENTKILTMDTQEEVTEVELIKNSSENEVILSLDTITDVVVEATASDSSVLYDEINNPRGALSITYNQNARTITLIGYGSLEEWTDITFNISVAGIINSEVLQITIRVRIVDIPDAIYINGDRGTEEVSLRVFDAYANNILGTELRVSLSPSSQVYNNVLITLDSENTDDVTLFSNLLINDTAFNGEYRFKSGDTLYLRNTGGNGQIALWVYAEDVMGTPDEVRRHLIINLEQGVTEISVPQGILDSESQNLILQLDEYEISDYSIKRLQFNVQPTTASKDTVTVTSANENIVRVNRVDLDEGIIEVYAVSPGTTTLNFIAESGARYSLTVEVLVNLNQFSVNLSSTTSNAYIGPNETQSITVGSEEEHTLLYAYITSNSRISLTNAFYPNTVVTQNLIRRITFETTDSNRANAYNSSSNIYLDYLETSADGEVTITMTIEYTTLETQGLTPGVNKVIGRLTTSFDVRVFVPIDRIEVSETNVSLLAGLTTGSGGSSQQSAYDLENNSRTLRVNVYPSNSYIQADNAVWQVVENTSRLSIDREIGGETTATAAPMGSLDNTQITATVVVTVTDLNGIPYSREIRVVITKITRITDVYIDGYDDATRNSVGLYFEPFKEGRDSFELDVSVAPSNATNKNLEYIIFDAERLDSAATGDNIVRIDTGRLNDAGGRIYEYYRVVDRTNTAIYENQYVSNTAALTYDEATGNYTIEPLNAGYAFVFIMPQDIMQVKVDEITSLTAQLRDISNTSTIKRILITVADGEVVPFQLYTAEDVDSIRNGLDKNYTLMNTIDMSTYLIRNPNWIPIGSEEEPFSGTIQSVGFDDLGTTAVEQNIVGWTLSRDLNETNPAQDPNHLMNYGIFGVVTGSIKNINFYVNSYTINQTTCRNNLDGQAGSLNDYKFGVLAGWLRDGGEIDNLGVYCTNLTYIANTSTQTNDLYVNIGMVGMADLNSSITNVSSQITANLQSNDLIINFGGVVGQNNGQIGIDNNNNVFDILSNVTVNANITYTNSSKLVNNAFGGVVGINVGSGIVNSANATGQINANNVSHATVGGIAGYNSASLRDTLSAVIMQSAGNLGGVVGTNENGTLNYVYYEIYDLASTNCGLIGSGNTGGIVGVMRGGTLSRAIVQGYNRTSEEYNIVSTGGVFGGLIGLVEGNISIQNSFVNAGISATGGVAGGLVGENAIQSSLNIVNVYTRGLFNVGQGVQAGALIGESRNVGLNYVYAEFDNDLNVVGGGTLSSPAGVVILINGSDSVSTNGVRYLNKNSANATDLGYWSNLGFSISNTNTSMTWNIDLTSSPDEKINDGYPYLRDSDGTDFVRIIPEEIILNAKSFNNFNEDGKINSILNITGDDKKLILAYQETTYYLSDLFDLTTDPVLDVSSLNIQISCNSNTAIRLYSGTNYYDARIGIIGTGTAVITFTSSQNNSARDAIQICVVNGFDDFYMYDGSDVEYDENGDATNLINNGQNYVVSIKHDGTAQAFIEYYFNDELQHSVDGGIKFVTQDTNYNLGVEWLQDESGNNYYYLNTDRVTFNAVGDTRLNFTTTLIPYLNVGFYTIDESFRIGALNQYVVDIVNDSTQITFLTRLYYGATNIGLGISNDTTIYAGDALSSSITIYTDDYNEDDDIYSLLSYTLTTFDTETGEAIELINTENPNSIYSDEISVSFGTPTFNQEQGTLIIPFNIELSQSAKRQLTEEQRFVIQFWAKDDQGTVIQNLNTTLEWYFIPQKINYVEIVHFSDAVNTGTTLEQAGQLPTNTIIAGEYGLLRIIISPDYVNFDSIEVVSSVVNGGVMLFDQRVLSEEEDGVSTYRSWQTGVENIENGIRLYRVSNIDRTFDGTFYVRTIVSSQYPTGTLFTVTVNITQDGQVYSFSRTMTVHQPDTLSIDYAHYNSNLDRYIVATGTGYQIGNSTILAQNYNELQIEVGDTYESFEVTVDSASSSLGARIVQDGNRFYLYTGSVPAGYTITVSLIGHQNLSGLTNSITREITFMVVDFYISSVREGLVNGNTLSSDMRLAYIHDKNYLLRLFEGVDNNNLNTVTAITFDPNNLEVRTKILNIINTLNGIGSTPYEGWSAYVAQSDGSFAYEQLIANTGDLIDGNYYFYHDSTNGYYLKSEGVSTNSILRYDFAFYYDNGQFTLTGINNAEADFGLSTGNLNLIFYQVTSQEHPQPVYTLTDFMNMEADIDYILMNDIEIPGTMEWSPINTEIKSFNGNGYIITFAPSSISSSDANFGLFGTVSANTVLKNINIVLTQRGLSVNSSASSLTSLNFGVIAGTNNGSIYNCQVKGLNDRGTAIYGISVPTANTSDASFNIAGLVGVNNNGISNSRVIYTDITASGNVAGLVVQNSGVISGCYFSGGTITNQASSEEYSTAGLVITNEQTGKIIGSYTGGTYSTTTDGVSTMLEEAREYRDGNIYSGVTSAGFVYANSGEIADCYSALQIYATRASGFAFSNSASGTINRCYSTSDLTSAGTTSLNFPFIGVESTSSTTNNNLNTENGIVDCYYLDTGFATTRLEEATALSENDFSGANGTNAFTNFIFSRTGEAGSEFTGVWVFVNEDNLYFTPERFNAEYVEFDRNSTPQTNFGPKLVNASLIATPRMELASAEENPDTNEVVYTYTIKYPAGYFETHTYNSNDSADYNTDYTYDPIVVSSMEQFNDIFLDEETGEAIASTVTSDIRIISNLNQSNLDQNVTLVSPRGNYAGVLEGNGFEYSNLNLAVNDASTTQYGLIGEIGRVAGTGNEINHIGTVKNLTIGVLNVSCSEVSYVGALAGIVDSGNLYNIEITGDTSARVVGYNAVGGVAGLVSGTSRINNVSSNVGVTANYRANLSILYNEDLIQATGYGTSINSIKELGYAGGLFGILNITQFQDEMPTTTDSNEARVDNVTSYGNASVVGKVAGGVAGLIGVYTVVNSAEKIVNTNTLIRGYLFAGGIAGQNNGVIKYGTVNYVDDVQELVDSSRTGETIESANLSLFQGAVNTAGVGGIVGLNIGVNVDGWSGGMIQLSSNKVAVRDSTASYVGGIAGVVYGGDLRACFATGSLLGSRTAYLGGIVGYISDFSSQQSIISQITSPFGSYFSASTTLDYVVGLNNYLATDYNYYNTIHSNYNEGRLGAIGGLVGYCYDASLIYTTHTEVTDPDDPFAYLANPINFYVNQIYDRIYNISQVDPVESSTVINIDAVGIFRSNNITLATGYTRGFILNNYDLIFGEWDEFSISQGDNGMPSIDLDDVPNEIHIYTLDDLRIMYWHPDKTYYLENDLDFLDAETGMIQSAFYSIGSFGSPFSGNFYGNNHTIKNMYIINSGAMYVGMFGATNNATIRDLTLENIRYTTALSDMTQAYIGGLVAILNDSVVDSVNIINNDAENHAIITNASYVGGMFGRIRSIDGDTHITNCYVETNLILTDNSYGTNTTNVYAGGFAGSIEGQGTITNNYVTGTMDITYKATGSFDGSINHSIGGFAGMASNASIRGDIADVNITINNVNNENSYIGGFVGQFVDGTAMQVDTASDITINFNALSNTRYFFTGGLYGYAYGSGRIDGFIASGNIILNGDYGTDTTSTTASSNHQIGGIAANSTGIVVNQGYSITSIYNNTLFTNMDVAFYYLGNSNNINTNSIYADIFYSLTARDTYGMGKTSLSVFRGSGLTTGNTYFTKGDVSREYYSLNLTDLPSKIYNTYRELYSGNTGASKTNPIIIQSGNDFNDLMDNADRYLYYLQLSNLIYSGASLYGDNQIATLQGFYNGGGNTISLARLYNDNLADVTTVNYGLFGELVDGENQPTVVSGIILNDVNINANFNENALNFGIIAGKTDTNSIISNTYVYGNMSVSSGSAMNIGGLAGENQGTIIGGGVDLNVTIDGEGAINFGGLAGKSSKTITIQEVVQEEVDGEMQEVIKETIISANLYSLINDFVVGRTEVYNPNAVVGGLIGDNSGSALYARNSYTAMEIINYSNGTPTINAVAGMLNSGGTRNDSGIYYEMSSVANQESSYWRVFDYAEQRNSNGLTDDYTNIMNLDSAYVVNALRNYGLPYLSWLSRTTGYTVRSTGSGADGNEYFVSTTAQFMWAITNDNQTAYYKLINDIDFNLISEYSTLDFVGNLVGDGNYILNLYATLFDEVSGSVKTLGFDNVNTTGNILANSVSGSASQIFVKATQGTVIGSGNIDNSLSNGANFVVGAVDCFNTTITDEQFRNLDKTIWLYDSINYTLRAFVTRLGENTDNSSLTTVGSNIIYIYNTTDLENAIALIATHSGTYTLNFMEMTELDLQGKEFYLPSGSNVNISGLTTVRNGVISREGGSNANNTSNSITSIINCGIILDSVNTGVFGQSSSSYVDGTVSISDSVIVLGEDSNAVAFDTIEDGEVMINLSNLDIYSIVDKTVYLLANNIQNGGSVTHNISNVNAYNCVLEYLIQNSTGETQITIDDEELTNRLIENNTSDLTIILNGTTLNTYELVGENNSRLNIIASDATINGVNLVTTNNGQVNIQLNNSTITNAYIVDMNSIDATLTIEINNSTVNYNYLVNSSLGTLNVTINSLTQTGTDTGGIINQNSNETTITIGSLTTSGFTNYDVVGSNSGTLTINLSNAVVGGFDLVDSNTANLTIDLNSSTFSNGNLLNTNTGTLNVTMSGSTISGGSILNTNSGQVEIDVTNSTVTNGYIIQTNNQYSSATIELNSANANTNYLINNNAGTLIINVNSLTSGSGLGIVNQNDNNITFNVTNLTSTGTNYSMVNTNNANVNITLNGGTVSGVDLIGTNNDVAEIYLTNGSTVTNGYLINTNSANATATINIVGSTINNNYIVNTNSGTLNITTNILDMSGTGTGSLVNQNSGSITANITRLTFTNFDIVATVANSSSGTINLTIRSSTTLNATNVAGVVVTYTGGQITVTLNANLVIQGTTAGAIALNGEVTTLTVTVNSYTITVNDEQVYPAPPIEEGNEEVTG